MMKIIVLDENSRALFPLDWGAVEDVESDPNDRCWLDAELEETICDVEALEILA